MSIVGAEFTFGDAYCERYGPITERDTFGRARRGRARWPSTISQQRGMAAQALEEE
jgi:hypothetical protein